ncbi:PHP domain protein [Thalassoporum mexicanum PCC 7367]|uniref:PHP domain-containing protein n=1 Tax=Thalassoporum mexicanum TaxID=3457544 RepID=UPI00029FF77D|nr:PHP domain-containing protein [Pseudanabaena sp. PCC 7367]AFY69528.1 PHP domain protein [Pseudanabaena sp. PCC 7367]
MISQAHALAKIGLSVELKQIFTSVEAHSCPNIYNFHLHSINSDGKMQVEDIVNQAIELGMSHLAITDHHTVAGYRIAKQLLDAKQSDRPDQVLPKLWVGVEINASLMFTEVHILAYGFDPDHAAMQVYLQGKTTAGIDYQAINVINAIHQAGGLAVLAHPVRYRRSAEDLIPVAANLGIDGVETYYSYDNCFPWRPSPVQTENVRRLGDRYGLLHTCGTDSHGLKITKRI